jgi:hypothetical protein
MNASLAFNANALDPQIGTLGSNSRRDSAYNEAERRLAGRKNLERDLVGFLPL